MPNQIRFDCPHCRTKQCGFSVFGYMPVRATDTWNWGTLLAAQCPICSGGLFLHSDVAANAVAAWTQSGASAPPISLSYPEPPNEIAPEHIPPNVQRAFEVGVANLEVAGHENAAGMMFRRALELAVKSLNPIGQGELAKRIEALDHGLATISMKEWAKHVRLGGNDAAHGEDELTREEAIELRDFTETFLVYAFTLPEKVRRAQTARTKTP